MGNKRRPSKYETHVVEHLEEIKEWRYNGETELTIAKRLRVAYSTFHEYKRQSNKYCINNNIDTSALSLALRHSTGELFRDIEDNMFKKAKYGSTITHNNFDYVDGEKIYYGGKDIVSGPDNTMMLETARRLRPDLYGSKIEFVDTEAFESSVDLVNNILSNANRGDIDDK